MLRDKAEYGVFDPIGKGAMLLTSESFEPDDKVVPRPVDPGQDPRLD
jgi:hypothetical protein